MKTAISIAAAGLMIMAGAAAAQQTADQTVTTTAQNPLNTTQPPAAGVQPNEAQRQPDQNSCFGQARAQGAQTTTPMGRNFIRERAQSGTNASGNRAFREGCQAAPETDKQTTPKQ